MPIITLSKNNSINIPVELIKKAGLISGEPLFVEVCDGILIVRSAEKKENNSVQPVMKNNLDEELPVDQNKDLLRETISRKNLQTQMQIKRGVGPKLTEL